jgi:hypothetical protein
VQAQPYRSGKGRMPGLALNAMRRGRTAGGVNPADITRGAQRLMREAKARKRPPRPARPPRPPR